MGFLFLRTFFFDESESRSLPFFLPFLPEGSDGSSELSRHREGGRTFEPLLPFPPPPRADEHIFSLPSFRHLLEQIEELFFPPPSAMKG